ncbi:phage portal protein [Ancylobacter sp. WKF20]|uniref:phage portal protein n=1 Tax=Ancylobacter sp. WKF20 TaxID=3039801 RepID=UPI0024341BD1|nr:phage portal protein [Ancylobacter sp. WKF20]WGD31218.1 phage portal protein [Ancylobacter sp. WKF20]
MRRAVTRDGWRDVYEAGERAYALALDFMQNSGWIAGAVDQLIVDTVGVEMTLNLRSDLSRFGYDDKEATDWCSMVEGDFYRYAGNPRECDLAGKATLMEMLDGAFRHYLSGGEALLVSSFLTPVQRAAYGVTTGTKFSLVAPHRLVRTTNEFDRLYQGIFHDENNRPIRYRFKERERGMDSERDIAAFDGAGLPQVIHVMDRGVNPDSPRGISPLTPVMKTVAQRDQLADSTLAKALIAENLAATITSPEQSLQAFEAIQTIGETPMPSSFPGTDEDWRNYLGGLCQDMVDIWHVRMEGAKEGSVGLTNGSRIGHLGPGEKFEFHTPDVPGDNYLPFNKNMQMEIARCLGLTYESYTGDHEGATYTSERMGGATIWPIAVRRRGRIVLPLARGVFMCWLDERIASGLTPFKGGYRAFRANREAVCAAVWQGPSKPSADAYKDALTSKVKLEKGLTTLAAEYGADGKDWEQEIEQQAREVQRLKDLGLPNPYQAMSGGAGPNGGAADGLREPAQ